MGSPIARTTGGGQPLMRVFIGGLSQAHEKLTMGRPCGLLRASLGACRTHVSSCELLPGLVATASVKATQFVGFLHAPINSKEPPVSPSGSGFRAWQGRPAKTLDTSGHCVVKL